MSEYSTLSNPSSSFVRVAVLAAPAGRPLLPDPVVFSFLGLFGSAFLPRLPGSLPNTVLAAFFSIVFVAISSLNLSPASSAPAATSESKF